MHIITLIFLSVVLTSCSRITGSSPLPIGLSNSASTHPLTGSGYKVLYSFKGGATDGANPLEGLTAVNGTLYGTTTYGGQKNFGTIFNISTSGTEQVLHSFEETPDGWYPITTLLALNGALYGTTSAGGQNVGTVFTISASGTESVLYSFGGGGPDGASPWAGLIAAHGKLYGTTLSGGSGFGTVFALSTSGTESVLYKFENTPDGSHPDAPLINVKGTLYGTTAQGGGGSCGPSGCGTIFEMSKSGAERLLYTFKGSPDGANPGLGGLIFVHGALYGTTESGGANNAGSVFKITPSGEESIVYSFKGAPDGAQPDAGLLDVRGVLYGTTTEGGSGCAPSNGCGTIFRVSRSGKERVLYRFQGEPDGSYPETQLTKVNGMFYGTTSSGGASGKGTVFRISP